MKKMSLQEIQQCEFEILCEFDRICLEKNLKYSLGFGTLLGAVRHKDFIPWDDDIDVYMPRPDYDRILQEFSKMADKKYKLLNMKDVNYIPMARIIDTQTIMDIKNDCIEKNESDKHIRIDIFPLDGLPDDMHKSARILKKAKKMRRAIYYCFSVIGKGGTPARAILKIPVLIFHKIYGKRRYAEKLDELARNFPYDSCDHIASVACSSGTVRGIFPKASFENLVQLDFHGHSFWAISNWHQHLTGVYGNYMQLPPEKDRVSLPKNVWQV